MTDPDPTAAFRDQLREAVDDTLPATVEDFISERLVDALEPVIRQIVAAELRRLAAELDAAPEFDGFPYLRLALTRTRGDQQTVTFRRQTLVQAVRQCNALEAEVARLDPAAALPAQTADTVDGGAP